MARWLCAVRSPRLEGPWWVQAPASPQTPPSAFKTHGRSVLTSEQNILCTKPSSLLGTHDAQAEVLPGKTSVRKVGLSPRCPEQVRRDRWRGVSGGLVWRKVGSGGGETPTCGAVAAASQTQVARRSPGPHAGLCGEGRTPRWGGGCPQESVTRSVLPDRGWDQLRGVRAGRGCPRSSQPSGGRGRG